jgi:hypothetical protein
MDATGNGARGAVVVYEYEVDGVPMAASVSRSSAARIATTPGSL